MDAGSTSSGWSGGRKDATGGAAAGRTRTACRCRPTHLGLPVDAVALNRSAEEALASGAPAAGEVDCLVVPGYTPRFRWRSAALHPLIAETCAITANDLAAGVAAIAIVTGGAVHGPANEAVLMREQLLALGVPASRILVEPCARHTTTNLRNAGRMMLELGLRTAYVVVPDANRSPLDWFALRYLRQAAYVGFPRLSGFALRCRLVLGYEVGRLSWVRPHHVRFVPSPRVGERSWLAELEGDP
jgi:DUF218 domain-containing protein